MKTSLLLAIIASTALATSALAQSTGTSTDTGSGSTGTGSSTTTTTGTGDTTGTAASSSTGANSGSGSTTSGTASSTPGSQSPNPNVYGNSSGAQGSGGWNQGGWGGGYNGGFGGQPMMQSMMTCVSPAPMGGFGSFACYPTGWGMGMNGMGMNGSGWHHMHHGQWGYGYGDDRSYSPNDYYQDRQSYQRKSNRSRLPSDDNNGYDNDWRSNSGGYDDNSGSDDYSNQ